MRTEAKPIVQYSNTNGYPGDHPALTLPSDAGISPGPSLRTRIARQRLPDRESVRSLAPGIDLGVGLAFDDPAQADATVSAGGALYARDGSKAIRQFEQVVADLEGAEAACATPSGMGAISLALFALLRTGDRIVVDRNCYYETAELLTGVFRGLGVQVDFVPFGDLTALKLALEKPTRLLLVETISNPGLQVADLGAIARTARSSGAILMVDNTFATPLLCRPLDHGAGLTVESCGKFLSGHSDVTAGIVAGSRELIGVIKETRRLLGQTPGSFDAWLALRGLKTLYARMTLGCATAKRLAVQLQTHPAVAAVRYPGLSQPETGAAATMLEPFGGTVLGFDLKGGPRAADQFVRALRLIPFAATVGGTTTIVSFPNRPLASTLHDSSCSSHATGSVRLSAGLESPDDLGADLAQALDRLAVHEHLAN